MADYLTRADIDAFGPEIIDVIQRGSRQALAPVIDRLEQQNEQLQDHVAREMQLRLHQQVVAAVPNWDAINQSPHWLAWLSQNEPLNGVPRQRLLNDAVASGDAQRVINFFRGFLRETGQPAQPAQPTSVLPASYPPASSRRGQVYSRQFILDQAARRRKGQINDADWLRWEAELCRASAEGRIAGGLNPATGCPPDVGR